MITAILYSLLVGIFVFSILAYSSIDQTQQKFYRRRSQILMLVYFCVFGGYIYLNGFRSMVGSKYPIVLIYFLFAFSIFWPQLISRLIVRRRAGKAIIGLKPKLPMVVGGLFMAAVLLWLLNGIWLLTSPDAIIIENHPEYSANYLWMRVSAMLFAVPGVCIGLLMIFQGTVFYANGLLHDGRFWSWSDIETYTWIENPSDKKTSSLQLECRKSQLGERIWLDVPTKEKDNIQQLLARQNVTSNSY